MNVSRFSVAPMMDWTDRHCRYFHRLLHPEIVLYTEMVTTGALLNGDTERFLEYNEQEHPLILQLGGSDPLDLGKCAKMAEQHGYDGVNLNCGCPSERVQKGAFGACLMAEPELVADCIKSMQDTTPLPVTIKCRIGIDDSDEYRFLEDFIIRNKEVGCKTFIIHARKAWLKGLSPKDNREIPPLNYERVYRLKKEHPDLDIHINGGIKTIEDITNHLDHIDGIMIGREAYQHPSFLLEVYNGFSSNPNPGTSKGDVIEKMMLYAENQIRLDKAKLHDITRHMLGLFHGEKGAKSWRRHLSKVSNEAGNDPDYIRFFSDRIV